MMESVLGKRIEPSEVAVVTPTHVVRFERVRCQRSQQGRFRVVFRKCFFFHSPPPSKGRERKERKQWEQLSFLCVSNFPSLTWPTTEQRGVGQLAAIAGDGSTPVAGALSSAADPIPGDSTASDAGVARRPQPAGRPFRRRRRPTAVPRLRPPVSVRTPKPGLFV